MKSLLTKFSPKNTNDTAFMEGEEKGIGIGVEKGKNDRNEEVTVNALKEGFSYEIIQKLTSLSFSEIDEIKKKYFL